MKQTAKGTWCIETEHDADLVGRMVAGRPWVVGLDVETRPADGKRKTPKAWLDPLVGVGISFYEDIPDAADAAPINTFYGMMTDEYLRTLTNGLAGRKWYAHNAMFDAQVVRKYGVVLGEHVGDPRIIAYLLGQPEAGLKPLIWEYFQEDTEDYVALLDEFDAVDLRTVPLERQADYCGTQDAAKVVRLERTMRADLADRAPRAFDVYTRVELPMVPILVEMTHRGMRVDRDAILPRFEKTRAGREGIDKVIDEQVKATGFLEYEKRGGELWLPTCKSCRNGKLKRVGCEACGGAGKLAPVPMTFNPGSWQQRGRFLYDHIGIPKRRFAGNVQAWQVERGYYDEDEVAGATDSLAMLQAQHLHPIIPTFLTRSKLAKDEGFLAKWWEMSKVDSRLHSEFANTTVASGRLSSRDPNLMQVTMRFRDLFVPDEDCELVPGDMSQLELVVAAYMSRDPVMIEIIRQGWDMHRITAEAIYSVPWRDVPKDSSMRAVSKVANFLSNYGGQKRKLQEGIEKDALSKPELGIVVPDLAECSRILMAHKRKYVGYWAWVERTKARTRALGYAETAFGRPRFFPDINSDNDEYRSEAERAAVNHAIQGTAADLMKMAMVNISRDKLMNEWGYMVLQVHDEIVSVVQKNYVAAYSERLKTHMELAQPFEPVVPLRAEVTHGMTWQGAHK